MAVGFDSPMGAMSPRFQGLGSSEQFPDPFADVASLSMPSTMRSALYWSEHIFSLFGEYAMAMERIVSYFLTDFEITETSDDEAKKWQEFLTNTADVMTGLQDGIRDKMCYGNAFFSIIVPFRRFLCCKRCGSSFPLKVVADNPKFNFSFEIPEFKASCPHCGYVGSWNVDDKPDDEERSIKLKRWRVHEIEILHDHYTGDAKYIWRIPDDYKRKIKEGSLFHLERCSLQVMQAIAKNQVFLFNDDAVFHMKEPTLGGILNRGWGVPRILRNFRQIYYVQVLRRFNEAIALDYVIPFRLITPATRTGSAAGGSMSTDPLMTINGRDFSSQVQSMVRRRRRDPASWQVLPFPVDYKIMGGEANQLAPRDLLDQGMESLLNAVGTPVELYKGSLQVQAAPVALRLFESTWRHLVHDANKFLRWFGKQVSQILSWEVPTINLKRITIADDLQKQMSALQLYMGQQLSGRSALAGIGFDWDAEQRRINEEARIQAENQARTQEEMEQAGFAQQIAKGQMPGGDPAAGGGGGGGAPPGGGGGGGGAQQSVAGANASGVPMAGPVTQYLASAGNNTPQTPEDMLSAASSMADGLLGMPESAKDAELRKLKSYNPVLHGVVKEQLAQKRRDTRMQAGNQALAAMQQGGGGG